MRLDRLRNPSAAAPTELRCRSGLAGSGRASRRKLRATCLDFVAALVIGRVRLPRSLCGACALAVVLGVLAMPPRPALAQDAQARWEALSRQIVTSVQQGQAGAAIPLAEQGLALARQAFGDKNPPTLTSLNILATLLLYHGIEISMDGRGRCHDNIFVERLWWTVKHEWVYLRPAANGIEQKRSLAEFFDWYNLRRPHQALGWRTPDEAYLGQSMAAKALAA
jgi:hypothetical protein